MKNLRKALSLFMAVCFVVTALCSVTAFAADESYMEVTYSRDFTKLTGTEGTWNDDEDDNKDGIDYSIDDIEVGSLYRASTTTGFPVTVGAEGIKATKPYYLLNKSLSGKWQIEGSFKDPNNGAANQLKFMFNFNKNSGIGSNTNIEPPLDGNGFVIFLEKQTTGDTIGHTVRLMKYSTEIKKEEIADGYRFTQGNVVDFVLSYDNANVSLTLTDTVTNYTKTFAYDLAALCGDAAYRTEGYFALRDQNSTDSGMYLRNLTVKEEYSTGNATLFEEDFNALAAAGTTYETYDIDSLGWSTYTAKTNSAVSSSYITGQLELFKGTTPCGLTSSGDGIAVYDTVLGNTFNTSAYIRHYLTSFTKIWFNSEFTGTTNESGFYFAFDNSNKQMTLVYVDGASRWTLDTDTAADLTFLADRAYATYDLSYDNGVVNLKVYNESGTSVIDKSYNLSEICAENNVGEYNTTGNYAIEFAGGGFMDIRNVSITAPIADLALVEKITDSDKVVSTSVVYQSPALTPVNVIAAAYDVTGALIGVDIIEGTQSMGKIDFEIEKSISADSKKVKFFLIDSLDKLTPMCAAAEIAVQ